MPIGFLAIASVFSVVVMLLWNWLMPTIFGLITINFWQALGLLALCRILLGGFGGGHKMMRGGMHGMHGHNHMKEKWMNMTPEQQKEFINKRRKHMHDFHSKSFFFDREDADLGTDAKPKSDD